MSMTQTAQTETISVTLAEAADIITSTWRQPNGHEVVISLLGEPGIGKSALGQQVSRAIAPSLGIPYDRIKERNMSDMDTPDVRGLPDVSGDATCWKPDAFFRDLAAGTGPALLQIEEMNDCSVPMQNLLCRLVRDRYAGDLRLTDPLYILLTGNRVSDKSGANRLSTKLGNRMLQLTVEFDQRGWEAWAHAHGVGADILAFHRWKADTEGGRSSAIAFDPNRSINPTARAWAEMADRIDRRLPPTTYLKALAGAVGLGPATEFVAFQQYWKDLPSLDTLWASVAELTIPADLQGQYALALYAASAVTPEVMPAFVALSGRLTKTLTIPMMLAAQQRCPAIVSTTAYSQWAVQHAHLMF
jgi:hypothetical protein